MTRTRTFTVVTAAAVLLAVLYWLLLPAPSTPPHAPSPDVGDASAAHPVSPALATPGSSASTTVFAHNILLRKGPTFRIYLRYIRGLMLHTHPSKTPSFDDPDSFVFVIERGVIHANLGDIGTFLNAAVPAKFPLKNIVVRGAGDQVRLTGTIHKFLIPLPVALQCQVSATADGRIHLHITKIDVLKLPIKGLLRVVHVELDDIIGAVPMKGVDVSENDIFFDTLKLLPPPHIRGQLTQIRVDLPDLVLTYGNAPVDERDLKQWHNFFRLNGGTVDFGNFTMHPADLTFIDASKDAWFDLDLVNYKAQLVNAYSRTTAQSGLEFYMPDLDNPAVPKKKPIQAITLDWLKNRDLPPPPDVPVY